MPGAFIRNRIEGLILCGTMKALNRIFLIVCMTIKSETVVTGCVIHVRDINSTFKDVSFVNVNNEKGVQLQINHLLGQDRKHIAFIAGPSHDSDMHLRKKAYSELIQKYHEPLIGKLAQDTSYLEHGYVAVDALLDSRKKIDAIIAYDDDVAQGPIGVFTRRA